MSIDILQKAPSIILDRSHAALLPLLFSFNVIVKLPNFIASIERTDQIRYIRHRILHALTPVSVLHEMRVIAHSREGDLVA